MIVIALAILLSGAALSFGLSRLLPTRVIGAATALLCWVAIVPVLAEAPDGSTPLLTPLLLGEAAFSLTPWLPSAERGLALLLLLGAGATMLALAGAIAGGVRGFGPLFAWALIAVAATLLSLAAPPESLVHPLAWAGLTLAGYSAIRASGVEGTADALPPGLVAGLIASVLLCVALLGGGGAFAQEQLPPWPAAVAALLAALALAGCPPLLPAREEAVGAPAPLGALLFGLCGPAAALGWLLRAVAALPVVPTSWEIVVVLLGALGALACGAGALGERRLRPLLAWVAAAQASLVLVAAGLAGPLAALAGPVLLSSAMLATALGATAVVSYERVTGTDDYTAGSTAPRLVAIVWGIGALACLGLPPLWGFWARLWLLEAVSEQRPWLLAPLLAGFTLLVLALLAPFAGLLAATGAADRERGAWQDWLPGSVVLLPLLVLGVAPGLVWEPWLQAVPFAPPAPPLDPFGQGAAVSVGLLLIGGAALLARAAPVRNVKRDPEEDAVLLGPEALAETLRPLAWFAGPRPLIAVVWQLLERISHGLRFAIGLFEQRYYLLGVLGALITIMLLMAQ